MPEENKGVAVGLSSIIGRMPLQQRLSQKRCEADFISLEFECGTRVQRERLLSEVSQLGGGGLKPGTGFSYFASLETKLSQK